ncbi:MAG TPA: hypothetical protein DEF00_02165 [Candidatus Taylorbacteria bacterium]|nr:MAG: hypothetical protein UY03_C0006G0014 [Parcubacteria group bacterium GW2011_GWA2_47_64]KKU96522.1 MAG: hypothetical protein UY29_C0010G0027 [Parcubacteria group bacterium GW2011_GWC2_48_17]HBV01181.1 hypothetical protein [Candidatus Taylorbacteria bacterium]
MDNIFLGKKLVAVHVRRFPDAKTMPVTSPNEALQLLTLKRMKGDIIKAHLHVPKKRVTKGLQECTIVIKGKIRCDLFDKEVKCFRKVFVREGEAMLTLGVAHSVHFLEDSLVYELKNGPFIDDKKFI